MTDYFRSPWAWFAVACFWCAAVLVALAIFGVGKRGDRP